MTPRAEKIGEVGGFEAFIPTSGGKAGAGCALTSSIQLRRDNCIAKQFRFDLPSPLSRSKAIKRAKAWAIANPNWKAPS